MTRLRLKVTAGASRDAVEGWLGDALKVRVRAQPERGRANAAVVKLLAGTLGIARSDVSVLSGHTSTRKVVEIAGLDRDEMLRRLSLRAK